MSPDRPEIGYLDGEEVRNNITTYMDEHVRDFGDRPALRWVRGEALEAWPKTLDAPLPHEAIDYASFRTLIARTAEGLCRLGIARGDRVLIFLPMGLGMYTAMLATQWIGAAAVFLDSWARRDQLGASARCADPKAVISHALAFQLMAGVEDLQRIPLRVLAGPGAADGFAARLEALMATDAEAPRQPVRSSETALITFTTGSSGTPKGANRTHRFLAAQHLALRKVIAYESTDQDLPAFPIFSLHNLASGVTTLIPAIDLARPAPSDACALANQIRHERLTCSTLSPSMLNALSAFCHAQGVRLETLRRVVTGGAPISKDDVRAFIAIAPNCELWILYGSTEVEPMAHIEAKDMLSRPEPLDPEIVEDGVNVGHLVDSLETKFLRVVKGPVELGAGGWAPLERPRGEVGELCVMGEHVCRDYYRNPEAFRKSKIVDPEGRVWHRTGDLARLDERGDLWIVGRVHNAIDRAGRYCFPVRAEIVLKRVEGVRRAAYLGLPDEELTERAVAAVELEEGAPGAGAIGAEIERLFQKNEIPLDEVHLVPEIPMDPRHHSKVEYQVLRARIAAGETTRSVPAAGA